CIAPTNRHPIPTSSQPNLKIFQFEDLKMTCIAPTNRHPIITSSQPNLKIFQFEDLKMPCIAPTNRPPIPTSPHQHIFKSTHRHIRIKPSSRDVRHSSQCR